jgi:poly-beta-hydroxyalkanoate depolymerase
MRVNICPFGQALAAQDPCSGIPFFMTPHHFQTGFGHYFLLSGHRFGQYLYPI